ncbi:hypothetical protein H4R22_000990 [Coemansia sp. RSA 1290]|nr:hypothetical protein H4R22_000990 [Coemansia sp. RSA 1290]KAJ2647135.1 hypothetical protein IWW40_004933 [Coemansia sp. RSA 1250]
MPSIGLGTWQQRDSLIVRRVVHQALEMGYRLIDTASAYRNEAAIGETLSHIFAQEKHKLRREDIWITSKLAPKQQGLEQAESAVYESLEKLCTDYIDLYLIHWPGVSKKSPDSPEHRKYREESWKSLEKLYKQGKVRAIGVSNYTIRHLEEMKEYAEILPMVNQCELHPLCPQSELLQYCQENGIAFTAYASFGESALLPPSTQLPELSLAAARRPDLTCAQILLLWGLQHNAAVIPKSSSEDHLRENLVVTKQLLSSEELEILDKVDHARHKHFCWNPEKIA